MKSFYFKNLIFLLVFVSISIYPKAQGWVGDGANILYSVNSDLNLSPINVGIGTATPSAQFHTTGSVKFAGITNNNTYSRVLVQDNNGKLYYRDASTIGTTNAWLLTGNSGTNPGTNFLGTTDNQRLVFKTNNIERATILSTGFFGVGLNNPQFPTHIYSTTPDFHLGLSGTSPSIRFFSGTDWTSSSFTKSARMGLATSATDFVPNSISGDFVIQTLDTVGSLIFGTGQKIVNGFYNGVERMRINKIGYVGISTLNPTAKLDIECSTVAGQTNPSNIRFENLQTGTGNYLVIDNNGYVFTSSTAPGAKAISNNDLEVKVTSLENEIQELRLLIQSITTNSSNQNLYHLYPNPTSNSLVIEANTQKLNNESVIVTDAKGKAVTNRLPFHDSLKISVGNLFSGVYFVSIYNSDRKIIETQKIIVVK